MFEITTTLDWHGQEVTREIKASLNKNIKDALRLYRDALRLKISVWGSFPGLALWSTRGVNIRKRVVHSKAGEPPRRQTGNLYNSIDIYTETKEGEMTGYVGTDVPYAPTLEFGGSLQVMQNEKDHTNVILSNPIVKPITISPRPAWIPTFEQVKDQMLAILMR